MELVLTEEQRLLRESAVRFVEQHAGPAAHRQVRESAPGFDQERLRAAAADGWLGLMVSPGRGGLGLGVTELALIMEQAGRGLMTEPVAELATVAWAISAGRAATGLGETLSAVMAGERVIMPALHDPATSSGSDPKISAMNEHHGYQLTGETGLMPYGGAADDVLVKATTQDGTLIYVVKRVGSGIVSTDITRLDGTQLSSLDFPGVFVVEEALVASREQGEALAAQIFDRVLLGQAAEMLGIMQAALDMALEYLRTREQFGRPIGSFQALQHKVVDQALAVETTRSLLYQTCKSFDAGQGQRAMVAAVKAQASDAVVQVTRTVIQLHGAIGFTDEYDAGLYLKRAMALSVQYGTASDHRRRFEKLSELAEKPVEEKKGRRRRSKRRRSVFEGMANG